MCMKYFLQDIMYTMDYDASSEEKKQNGCQEVAQWLRIHLPMQGTQVRALVREDPN